MFSPSYQEAPISAIRVSTVCQIFTCPAKGAPLVSHSSVRAAKHSGLAGDRWYRSRWREPEFLRRFNAWRKRMPYSNTNVSIISLRDLAMGNDRLTRLAPELSLNYTPQEMRRNLVLDGDIDLNLLEGREFSIGKVRMRWSQACTPCGLPAKRSNKGHPLLFKKAFGDPICFSGIRAKILNSGTISIGDTLTVLGEHRAG